MTDATSRPSGAVGVVQGLTRGRQSRVTEQAMSKSNPKSFEDPVRVFLRALRKLHSLWLSWTYPFASVGRHFSVHYSCNLSRTIARYISIGNTVLIDRNCRVDVPVVPEGSSPAIIIDDECRIG